MTDMEKIEQRISPSGFARLKYQMMIAELNGNGPDACARIGLTAIGLSPRDGVEVVFVVDGALSGPVYPFMDWPAELAAEHGVGQQAPEKT